MKANPELAGKMGMIQAWIDNIAGPALLPDECGDILGAVAGASTMLALRKPMTKENWPEIKTCILGALADMELHIMNEEEADANA